MCFLCELTTVKEDPDPVGPSTVVVVLSSKILETMAFCFAMVSFSTKNFAVRIHRHCCEDMD